MTLSSQQRMQRDENIIKYRIDQVIKQLEITDRQCWDKLDIKDVDRLKEIRRELEKMRDRR